MTDLPDPDSPTIASTSPGREVERDAVDGLHDPLLRGEGDREVAHGEKRLPRGPELM